jgi:hypothetical protein
MRCPGSPRIETVLLLMAIVVWTSLTTPAGAQAPAPLFTADQEACFGRVYDRAHLASHPNQKVTSLHIFRSLGERPEAESWRTSQRDDAIKQFIGELRTPKDDNARHGRALSRESSESFRPAAAAPGRRSRGEAAACRRAARRNRAASAR